MDKSVELDKLVEKYKGKVLGSEEQIKNALQELGREPRDRDELEDLIFRKRNESLTATLEKAQDSLW